MGTSKTQTYSPQQLRLAKLAKGLAHPARVAILAQLMRSKTGRSCSELVQHLPLAQATVSQHLRELHQLNLIHQSHVDGRLKYIGNHAVVRELKAALDQLLEQPTYLAERPAPYKRRRPEPQQA